MNLSNILREINSSVQTLGPIEGTSNVNVTNLPIQTNDVSTNNVRCMIQDTNGNYLTTDGTLLGPNLLTVDKNSDEINTSLNSIETYSQSLATTVSSSKINVNVSSVTGSVPISGSVSITGTPAVTVSSGSVNATCSGSVSISGTPSVSVSNTPSVTISSGTVNATCSGTVAVSNFPATQPISGSVSISGTPSVTADVSTLNGNTISTNSGANGTGVQRVTIATNDTLASNIETNTNGTAQNTSKLAQCVSTVALDTLRTNVTNFPATQPISGSVTVSSGSVNATCSGTVAVSNFPATQPISGSVSITGTPSVSISGTPAVTLSSGTLTSITNSVTTSNSDITSMLQNTNMMSDWSLLWRYNEGEQLNLANAVNNTGKTYMQEIQISGSAPSKNITVGVYRFDVAATSEFLTQSRFIMGNFHKIVRWDFHVLCNAGFSDDNTAFYTEFGLKCEPITAHTNAAATKIIAFKIYKDPSTFTQRFSLTYANSVINSSSSFNIQNTVLPSGTNIYNSQKWSIILTDIHNLAIFGTWQRGVFYALHYIAWQNQPNNNSGALFPGGAYKPFYHVYNNSANSYTGQYLEMACFTPGPVYEALTAALNPYKIWTTDYISFTSATSMNPICFIQLQDTTANVFRNYPIKLPIAIFFRFYVTGGLVGEVQIKYCGDNTQTLSSPTYFESFIIQPTRALVTTNGTTNLGSLYGSNELTFMLPNAYQCLGYNDSNSSKACIFIQGLTLVSVGSLVYSMTFYTL